MKNASQSERGEIRLSPKLKKAADKRARALGMGFSGYVRYLIAQDTSNGRP
jgi:predicted DNA binding CopG/RHH family protein